MNIFDYLNIVYTKENIDFKDIENNINVGVILTLISYLYLDKSNLKLLSKLIPNVFLLPPSALFIYLYFGIPQKSRAPFLKKVKVRCREKDLKKYQFIKEYFKWTNEKLRFNMDLIDKIGINKFKEELVN